MELPMDLRQAQQGDLDRLVAGNRALAAETEGLELPLEALRAGVAAVLADRTLGRYRVAQMDSEVVGQLLTTSEWSDWRAKTIWWIQSVYVWPEARGRGVFRELYRMVREEALETGVGGLRLYVDTRNTAAMETYRRVGMNGDHYRVFETIFSQR